MIDKLGGVEGLGACHVLHGEDRASMPQGGQDQGWYDANSPEPL